MANHLENVKSNIIFYVKLIINQIIVIGRVFNEFEFSKKYERRK